MDIPYGYDCFAFQKEEIKYFSSNLTRFQSSTQAEAIQDNILIMRQKSLSSNNKTSPSHRRPKQTINSKLLNPSDGQTNYIRFTRKNEDYTKNQLIALGLAGRLNTTEMNKQIFCGIKVQIGIGVVTNFLRKGLQYKSPVKGRAQLINGTWTGIVKGLTVEQNSSVGYDLAFGNFLAWDEEFPYIKFGPFFAIESKLVMLTGSSRRIETSSFGTNMNLSIWLTIMSLLIVLSILASVQVHWEHKKLRIVRSMIDRPVSAQFEASSSYGASLVKVWQDFFFIYFTMLLNKPSVEFDNLIWPKVPQDISKQPQILHFSPPDKVVKHHEGQKPVIKWHWKRRLLPTSIRVVSYLWSTASFVMASIYSGEMLAVMLLHADMNIDTIAQLINSRPPIEPVIRQDDFTHTLMLNSLDTNMLKLYNKTRVIPRSEVYTKRFIENVSQRKQALLGDDELIDTIYDIYHKYYPLYRSKMTYLQYPISLMYRKDLNATLEKNLRRGMVQMFEMGLVHRWYQAQKETYIQFYDTVNRDTATSKDPNNQDGKDSPDDDLNKEQKYKPLSMHHFKSFLSAMFYCKAFAFLILLLEIIHSKLFGLP